MKTTLLLSSLCLLSAPLSLASLSPTLLSAQISASTAPRAGVESSICKNNNFLLSLDKTGLLLIHNAIMGTLTSSIQLDSPDAIVALSPDASHLAAGTKTAISLYEVKSGKRSKKIPTPAKGQTLDSVNWSPDGSRLLVAQLVPNTDGSGTYGKQFSVIDSATGSMLYQSPVMSTACSTVFTPDSKGLLMTGKTLTQIDISSKKKKTIYQGIAGSSIIAWNPSYTALAIDTKGAGLAVINPTGKVLFTLPDAEGIHQMQWSVDGNVLFVSEGHQGVCQQYVIDMDAKKLLPKLTKMLADRTNCQLSKSGEYIVECNGDTATIYSVLDEKKVKTIKLPDEAMRYLSPDAQELIKLDASGRAVDAHPTKI